MATNSLVVAVPMFNEAGNVERSVREMSAVIESMAPGVDLLCVDDGSTDATPRLLESCKEHYARFDFISHPRNMGYGHALATAAKHATARGYEFILFMDSDLTNDPALIPRFAELLSEGFDLVKASRYVPGGRMEGVPRGRQLVSRWGNWVAAHLFGMGINDCTNGFRAVRLSKLAGFTVRERGFASIVEELYHLKKVGVRATELPYTLTSRKDDEGVSKFRYRPRVFWSYLKYALLACVTPRGNAAES